MLLHSSLGNNSKTLSQKKRKEKKKRKRRNSEGCVPLRLCGEEVVMLVPESQGPSTEAVEKWVGKTRAMLEVTEGSYVGEVMESGEAEMGEKGERK